MYSNLLAISLFSALGLKTVYVERDSENLELNRYLFQKYLF